MKFFLPAYDFFVNVQQLDFCFYCDFSLLDRLFYGFPNPLLGIFRPSFDENFLDCISELVVILLFVVVL